MPDLGQILNSIHHVKNDLFQEEGSDPQLVEKEYKKLAFVVNRCLSYFIDTVFHAQEMNQRSSLDGKPQYQFHLHAIKKGKRFSRGMKIENPENLKIVKEYYNFSDKKARKALQILSPEDIGFIKARMYQGGIGKKKI